MTLNRNARFLVERCGKRRLKTTLIISSTLRLCASITSAEPIHFERMACADIVPHLKIVMTLNLDLVEVLVVRPDISLYRNQRGVVQSISISTPHHVQAVTLLRDFSKPYDSISICHNDISMAVAIRSS